MASRVVLLDTSFVVALENRDDPHHDLAKQLDRELSANRAAFVLHWGIMIEIADGFARVGRRSRAYQFLDRFEREEGYVLYPLTDPLLDDALRLYRTRADKEWGLTDCISFSLMKREQIHAALTADMHFRQAGFEALLLPS